MPLVGLVQVDDHHDPGLGGNLGYGDDADPDDCEHVVVHGREQPRTARDGKRQAGEDQEGLHPSPRGKVEQGYNQDECQRQHIGEARLHFGEELILPVYSSRQ